jgi:hypothetical protein
MNRLSFILLSNLTAACLCVGGIPDQSQRLTDTEEDWGNGIGQSFTVGMPGKLKSIRIALTPRENYRDLTLHLRQLSTDGTPTGEIIESTTVSGSQFTLEQQQWCQFNFTNGIDIATGQQLGFSIESGPRPTPNGFFEFCHQQRDPYPEGFFYFSGYYHTSDGTFTWEDQYFDLTFETLVYPDPMLRLDSTTSQVPLLSIPFSDPTDSYTIQHCTLLDPANWTDLAYTNGTGDPIECAYPTNSPTGFFRISRKALFDEK